MLITNQGHTLKDDFNSAATESKEIWIASGYISRGGCEALELERHAGAATSVRVVIGRAMIDGLSQNVIDYLMNVLGPSCIATGGGVRIAPATSPFHSKIYALRYSDGFRTWVGSSNLSLNGLAEWTEATIEIEVSVQKRALFAEITRLWNLSTPIEHIASLIPLKLPSRRRLPTNAVSPASARRDVSESDFEVDRPGIILSLLNSKGVVSAQDGLNWGNGFRGQKPRNPDDACFAVPRLALGELSAILGTANHGDVFQVTMHDGTTMDLMLQGGDRGKYLPKFLTTDPNSTLGRWILRKVLRLPPGSIVTRTVLESYGRTHVGIYFDGVDSLTATRKLFIDFSVPRS